MKLFLENFRSSTAKQKYHKKVFNCKKIINLIERKQIMRNCIIFVTRPICNSHLLKENHEIRKNIFKGEDEEEKNRKKGKLLQTYTLQK